MLILSRKDVERALDMPTCIAAVHDGFVALAEGAFTAFARHQLRAGKGSSLMGLMPVAADVAGPVRTHRPDGTRQPVSYRDAVGTHRAVSANQAVWALKAVWVAHDNRARGLDSHQGFVVLSDGETGVPIALVEAGAITALRTAAASAVATRALARPGVRRIAILGGGTQARSHAAAMRVVCPDAALVFWSRSGVAELAQELGADHAGTVREAVAGADVICTVTASPDPIVDRGWLAPGAHVNAVGSSRPDTRELGSDLVAAAEVFVDSLVQAGVECGEYLMALHEGRIRPDHIRAEIGAVLAGRHSGRSGPTALTVFKSLGIAMEDLVAARAAVDRARVLGLGTVIDWTG